MRRKEERKYFQWELKALETLNSEAVIHGYHGAPSSGRGSRGNAHLLVDVGVVATPSSGRGSRGNAHLLVDVGVVAMLTF